MNKVTPVPQAPLTKPPMVLVLHEDKQCKGSVRYGTNDPEAVVSSVYLSRKYASQMPQSITITISSK